MGPSTMTDWRAELATPSVLTVCSYAHFEPMIHGDGRGIEADLLRAVAAALGVGIRFVPASEFDGIWRRVLESPAWCDVAAGGLSATAERRADGVGFTVPHYRNEQSLLVRREDRDRIRDYPDLVAGRDVVGVVPGTTGERYAIERAREAGHDPATLIAGLATEGELLVALRARRITAIARGVPGNEHQAAADPSLAVTARRDFGERFAFAVDPRRPRLRGRLDEALGQVLRARGVVIG